MPTERALPPCRRLAAHTLLLALLATLLRAQTAPEDPAAPARRETGSPPAAAATSSAGTTSATRAGDTVVLSPFEVSGSGRGYYASNTMSGTRLNSRVEDLASSITVITKEQMADFALLDINDIFLYEAGTEGIGTYTEFAVDRKGSPTDNSLNPNGSNRVRGVGSANISFANFETSGRMPLDPSACGPAAPR